MASESDQPINSQPTEATPPVFDAAAIFSAAENSAVKIQLPGTTGYGSGFFVSSGQPHSCEIATLSHVTDGKDVVSVQTIDGQKVDAVLKKIDWKNQIAIYQLQNVQDPMRVCQDAQISIRVPGDSERLVGVGMAAGAGLGGPLARPFPTETLGFISRKDINLKALPDEDTTRDLLVLSGQDGQHGYSGAAIYDADGKVVAIEAGPGPDGTMVAEFARHLQDDLDQLRAERQSKIKE